MFFTILKFLLLHVNTFFKFMFLSLSLSQRLKCLPSMRETRVRSLGWEDPLEKEMATHSSILAWRSLVGYSPWGHKESDMTERLSLSLSLSINLYWNFKYLLPIFLFKRFLIMHFDENSFQFNAYIIFTLKISIPIYIHIEISLLFISFSFIISFSKSHIRNYFLH